MKEAWSCNGLHIAALFELESIGKQLLDANEVGVNDATKIGTTALMKQQQADIEASLKCY